MDERSQEFRDNLLRQVSVGDYLTDLQSHHPETYEHSLRVALLCIDMGFESELSGSDLRTLGFSGLLHDLGKTAIDEGILSKASSLEASERHAIDEHPRRGFVRLEENLYDKVRKVVVGHHEYNRAAFPRQGGDRRSSGRDGAERRNPDAAIETMTQIVAVADMCDALASARSYKKPFTKDQIRATLTDQFTGDPLYLERALDRL